jgi:hypothetical protein
MLFGPFGAQFQGRKEIRLRLKPAGKGHARHVAVHFRHAVLKGVGDTKQNRIAGPGIRNVPVGFRGARVPQLEASAREFAVGQIQTYSDQPHATDI